MQKKGFSLIELVIVLLILGIMAAVALVNAPSMPNIRGKEASRKIQSDIRYAQSFALSSQQRTRAAFDIATNSYTLYREPVLNSNIWVAMTNPLTNNTFTVTLGQGEYSGVSITLVNFVSANYHLVFDAEGAPYGYNPAGGAVTKMISSGSVAITGQATYTANVAAQTGRVSLP